MGKLLITEIKKTFKLWLWKFVKSEIHNDNKSIKLNINSHDLYNIIIEWTFFKHGNILLNDYVDQITEEYREKLKEDENNG